MSETYTWIEPKTDWYGFTDSKGVYSGDRFNSEDYNRIKNNLNYLHYMAQITYPDFAMADMGNDKGKSDYPYADEFNLLEENLKVIAENTWKADYGEKKVFHENGAFISYDELNRIEGAMLDLYNKLKSQNEGRRMLIFMLGKKEVF